MNSYLSNFGSSVSEVKYDGTHMVWFIENYNKEEIQCDDYLSQYCWPRDTYGKDDSGKTITIPSMRVRVPRALYAQKQIQLKKYRNITVGFLVLFLFFAMLYFVCWWIFSFQY